MIKYDSKPCFCYVVYEQCVVSFVKVARYLFWGDGKHRGDGAERSLCANLTFVNYVENGVKNKQFCFFTKRIVFSKCL